MPFGQRCEFINMDACVAAHGDKGDPAAYCATLMRETEEHCKMLDQHAATKHKQARLDAVRVDRPIYKQFTGDVEVVEDDRRVRFVITTANPDREGDVVETGGIDIANFEKNPVVQFAHDYRQPPIGRCVAIERLQDRLIATVEFMTAELNPFAEQVFRMVKAGFLRATSIGFRPLANGYEYNDQRGGIDFRRVELLEFSVVPIPANAEALMAASAAGIDIAVLKDWARTTLDALDDNPGQDNVTRALADGVLVRTPPDPARVPAGFVDVSRHGDAVRSYERVDQLVRWNPQLSKTFDVTAQEFAAASLEQDLAAKFCGVHIKDLYHRHEPVYSARMGAFLVALDETIAQTQVDDVRNLDDKGRESPPLYERIQLNSTRSEEFLIDGLRFLTWNGVKLALRVEPRWYGLQVTSYVARTHAGAGRAVLTRTFTRAKEFNFLRGEAFSLSGEFLTRGDEKFEDVFLDVKNTDLAKRLIALIDERGATLENRGVILLGPPGNGKTLLGRILMNQTTSTFVWCSARDFYYAGGFRGLADAFEIGRESAAAGTPCILFIEDVDNYLDGHTTDLMKTEMDGIAQSRGVVTILTTNYPEHLPRALIDRPGRFHDVVRFDLPDVTTRRRMLDRWMPELTGAALEDTIKALHGYSGAHVREFARFASIIREQDGVDVAAAATAALAKLQEQRDLITAVQVQGSRYRAPEHVMTRVEAPQDIAAAARCETEPVGAFARDVVAWRAFVKTRDKMIRKDVDLADEALADILESYGFEDEAKTMRPTPEADALAVQKRGRVLSKANETKIRDARDANHACAAMLDDVLASTAAMDDDDDDPMVVDAGEDADDIVVRFMDDTNEDADDVIARFADEDEPPVRVDPDKVGAAVRDALHDALGAMIARELTTALNEARGRLD